MRILPLRFLNRIAAAYLMLFCFVPPIQVGGTYRTLAVGMAVLWFITALLRDPALINGRVKNLGILCVTCLMLLFLWRLGVGTVADAFAGIMQPLIIMIIAFISLYAMKNDKPFLHTMFTVCLVLVCYYCITTIAATLEDPYASRIANSEWLEERFEGNEEVGLYGYVYMCVFLLPILLYKFIAKLRCNLFTDIVCWVAFVLIAVMTALAGYMIAIVCGVMGLLMVWLFRKPSVIRILAVVLICALLVIFYAEIAGALISIVDAIIGDNPVYRVKLDGFRTLYENGGMTANSTWYGRFKNYRQSWNNVINYPFAGCYLYGVHGGGGHSTILDTIGRFGWIISFLYFTILWKYPRKIVENGPKKHVLYTTILVLCLIFGALDPYSQELGMSIFFFTPYMVWLEQEHKNKQIEEAV